MPFERVKQLRCKAEITLSELLGILRTVYTGKIEHKVGLPAVAVKLFGGGVNVILKHLLNLYGIIPRLTLPYIIELGTEISTYKAPGSCYKYFHQTYLLYEVTFTAEFLLDIFERGNLSLGLFHVELTGVV